MNQNVYQQKNISKAVMLAALPAMLGQITTLIYNIADTYFVSLTKDPNQIAAVTFCAPILLIIMSIACIFGTGGNSIIARLLGAKENDKVKAVSSYCLYGILFSGIAVAIIGLVGVPWIVKAVGADEATAGLTADYLRYIFIGAPFIMFSNGMIHIFRSAGLIRQGTIGIILGNVINMILDYVFIVIFDMGTAGAALATSLGFFFTSIYYVICMHRAWANGNQLLPLSPKEYHCTKAMTAQVFKIGIPGALITILISVSNIVLNNYIGIYGPDAVAAYGIANKIFMIPIMLSVGLSQGIAPLIGYCYGAKEYKRLRSTVRISNIFGLVLGVVLAAIFVCLSAQLTGFFLEDSELIKMSARFLCVLSISSPIIGIINVVTAYFQALGKALPSLAITILRNVILFIGAVILLNKFYGLNGIIAAQPIVEVTLAIVCVVMYLKSTAGLAKE